MSSGRPEEHAGFLVEHLTGPARTEVDPSMSPSSPRSGGPKSHAEWREYVRYLMHSVQRDAFLDSMADMGEQVDILHALRTHPMFEGEGSIPKANVRFVMSGGEL